MIDIVARALVPIFFVIALGYFAGWRGKIDNRHVESLNALVMDFALPAAMFGAVAATSKAELFGQWALIAILTAGLVVIWLGVYAVQRKGFGLSSGTAAIIAMSVALPNSAATGMPLLTTVLGHSGRLQAVVGIAIGSVVLSPLTLIVLDLSRGRDPAQRGSAASAVLAAMRRAALSPLILAPLLAVVVVVLGWRLPAPVEQSFELLGSAASAVALLLTGIVLSGQHPRLSVKVAVAVLVVNIVHPALSWEFARLLPASALTAHAAILLSALPAGFFGILFALRYREDIAESASIVAASTVFSVVTLSGAIALTEQALGHPH